MPDKTPEQITAAEIIFQLGPLARIDAFMVIDMRERLMFETGCSPDTARKCILAELQKRWKSANRNADSPYRKCIERATKGGSFNYPGVAGNTDGKRLEALA